MAVTSVCSWRGRCVFETPEAAGVFYNFHYPILLPLHLSLSSERLSAQVVATRGFHSYSLAFGARKHLPLWTSYPSISNFIVSLRSAPADRCLKKRQINNRSTGPRLSL